MQSFERVLESEIDPWLDEVGDGQRRPSELVREAVVLGADLRMQVGEFVRGLEMATGRRRESTGIGGLLRIALGQVDSYGVSLAEEEVEIFDIFAFMNGLVGGLDQVDLDDVQPAGSGAEEVEGMSLPASRAFGIRGETKVSVAELRTALEVTEMGLRIAARLYLVLRGWAASPQPEAEERGSTPRRTMTWDEVDELFHDPLRDVALKRFSTWYSGSEVPGALFLMDELYKAGYFDEGRTAGREVALMTLWAMHTEFCAQTGEGSSGDWAYAVAGWSEVFEPDELEQLTGVESDSDDEVEVKLDDLANVVRGAKQGLVQSLSRRLGEAHLFATLWAMRLDDVDFPLDQELVGKICNDVDDSYQIDGYMWVTDGLPL